MATRTKLGAESESLERVQRCGAQCLGYGRRAMRSDFPGTLHGIVRLPHEGVDIDGAPVKDFGESTENNPRRPFDPSYVVEN